MIANATALFTHVATAAANCSVGTSQTFCGTNLPHVQATSGQLQTILQLVFGILAAVAVLIITIGAMRYVTSEGNPENTKKARSTIVYAMVGLVIALSAEAFVSFAVNRL